MKIQSAEEKKPIDIELSYVIGDDKKLNILPDVKNYFSLDYKPSKRSLTLVAGGYIGLIPVNSELAINIRPKVGLSNLTRMVMLAEDKFQTLDFFKRGYEIREEANSTVLQFLIDCLIAELKTLQTEGVLKEYIKARYSGAEIKGRINFPDTLKSFWSKGFFHQAKSDFYDLTIDNPFNQLIKYTLEFLLVQFQKFSVGNAEQKKYLVEMHSVFAGVRSLTAEPKQVMNIVADRIGFEKVSDLRFYYKNICEICRLILDQKGVSFEADGKDVSLNTFILDMASIFERYLLKSLRVQLTSEKRNISLLDGNAEGKKKFFNQPSLANGDAKPDFIFSLSDEVIIIADAKYKTKVKDSDRYQVISHALSYGASKAVLITLMHADKQGEKLFKIGSVGPKETITLYEYSFNLAAENLEQEENALFTSLMELIP